MEILRTQNLCKKYMEKVIHRSKRCRTFPLLWKRGTDRCSRGVRFRKEYSSELHRRSGHSYVRPYLSQWGRFILNEGNKTYGVPPPPHWIYLPVLSPHLGAECGKTEYYISPSIGQ